MMLASNSKPIMPTNRGWIMHKRDKIILWPIYFDAAKTRGQGRRVPKTLAVPSPRIDELKEAVERLGLKYEMLPEASYPKTPWLKTGVLLVDGREKKNSLVKKVAKQLLKLRENFSSK